MTDFRIYFAGRDGIPGEIVLGRGEKLEMLVVALSGESLDIPLHFVLEGEGASVNVGGVYLCTGEERLNISVTVEHRVGGCISNQNFRGIVGGSAQVEFYGRIKVAHDAQKTEAYQENHNLLLTDTARVATRPQLEIYADDVKCSHGATVGRLDEDAQFYMRSRGIPEDEARFLQMVSFLSPVLALIPDGESRLELSGQIETAVRKVL
ncbi:MAG: SufD family Fe-S cluster assembly protein, partial [Candidatus Cryptobacteroides sp.]